MNFKLQVLNDRQKQVIAKLNWLKQTPFYLAGGTALALQFGHRTSVDLDFYSPDKFDNRRLQQDISKHFGIKATDVEIPENTLEAIVMDVNISFFYYPYKLLDELIEFPPIKLAGLKDIAAMKIAAVIQRAKQRDFIDLYYLIISLGLDKVMEATMNKYPWYQENRQLLFKALTYFDEADADNEVRQITIFDKQLQWDEVKQVIQSEVSKYLHQGK